MRAAQVHARSAFWSSAILGIVDYSARKRQAAKSKCGDEASVQKMRAMNDTEHAIKNRLIIKLKRPHII